LEEMLALAEIHGDTYIHTFCVLKSFTYFKVPNDRSLKAYAENNPDALSTTTLSNPAGFARAIKGHVIGMMWIELH